MLSKVVGFICLVPRCDVVVAVGRPVAPGTVEKRVRWRSNSCFDFNVCFFLAWSGPAALLSVSPVC